MSDSGPNLPPSPLQKRTCSTVSIEVRKSQHKYIIGPRGQGLQEILLNSGVWVEVPSTDSDSNTITLRGPQEKLGHALTQVGKGLTCFFQILAGNRRLYIVHAFQSDFFANS